MSFLVREADLAFSNSMWSLLGFAVTGLSCGGFGTSTLNESVGKKF